MDKKFLSFFLVFSLSITSCYRIINKSKKISVAANKTIILENTPKFQEYIQVTEPEESNKNKSGISPIQKELSPKENNFQTSKTNNFNTTEKDWFYKPKKDGTPSEEPPEVLNILKKYSGYYLGDTSKKEIYLTFDEGYENGYTSKILDVLKENNVKAAFFVTTDYINRNKDLIKRMVNEGHLVCNHSNSHPSMAKVALKGKEKFEEEFTLTEKAFEEVTGTKMPKFFRPPMGKYSELSMHYTQELGYKTIFWSFAYKDWIPEKQPSHEYAKKIIMERTHNGGIFLLHAVSKTNAEILDSVIKEWKSKGFELKTLNDLPQ
ncbi:delta-lactam-biosynthetic de-N-acetylase [Clostridium prolinivorans]|jgi:peptidoglycan-N-acetylmuramic acid deacetylase|uniref:delta-lactam-biosynthetic de-N-acetylase n=1 Tax=Clostridium prolinivorans TaxID=2769420 RepID=UPI000FD83C34|nr:delta-lactam-biosynthetic de-N-acetylase [Clostridium prolinivorans]